MRPGSVRQSSRAAAGAHCLAQTAGRAGVDPQIGAGSGDHDAVLAARRFDRHVVVEHVLENALGIALERVTVPAGARLLERDHVSVSELAGLLAVHDLLARSGVEHGAPELSRLAAAEPVWRELLPVGKIRQLPLVREKPQIAADPAAAPEHAGTGRIADQLEALDEHRLVGLLRL